MAGSANSNAANRDAAMRRIAIVLSSLPASAAAKLLGSVDQSAKQSIRQTMAALADVDPLERHRALQAFKVSVQREPQNDSSPQRYQDDAFLNQSSPSSSPTVLKNVLTENSDQPDSPLAFLGDVEDDQLVDLLAGEHAQAVALVLASVAPAQAARVLPRLEPTLRSSALSRLGRLGDIPEAATMEVASHFRSRLSQRKNDRPGLSSGKRALDAIMAAMPAPSVHDTAQKNPVTPSLSAPMTNPVDRRDSFIQHSNTASPASQTTPIDPRLMPSTSANDPSTKLNVAAIDQTHQLRVAEHTRSGDSSVASQRRAMPTPAVATNDHRTNDVASQAFASTDAIHSHLIALSAKDLCAALGRVETREAMLTLCGLPNAKAEAVLTVLPRDQAKVVRGQMNSLGSMNLRDIDNAKEKVAMASLTGNQPVARPNRLQTASAAA